MNRKTINTALAGFMLLSAMTFVSPQKSNAQAWVNVPGIGSFRVGHRHYGPWNDPYYNGYSDYSDYYGRPYWRERERHWYGYPYGYYHRGWY